MLSGEEKAALDLLGGMFGGISPVLYVAEAEGEFSPEWFGGNMARVLDILPASLAASRNFWRERVHPDDADEVLHGLGEAAQAGCAVREFRLRNDAGRYIWVRNEVSFRSGGGHGYLAGCLRDISSEKEQREECCRNQEVQRAREHFYRSVLDSLPQRLFWKDRNSVFRGCNLSGAAALGLKCADEIVGKSDYDFYPDPQKADYLRQLDEQVMRDGRAHFHAESIAGDGESWLDVSKVPLCDEAGNVYGVLVSYEDVSALKKSEIALNKFKRAVEQSYNSVFITDTQGIIEYVNPEFLHTYGYKEHEVLGQTPRILKSGLLDEAVYHRLWETVLNGKHWRGELSNRKKNGEICWQSVSISPIVDESGEIAHFLAIEDDITAHKSLEADLKRELEFNQKMIDALPHPVYFKDAGGRYRRVNRAFEEMAGLGDGAAIGKTAFDLFPAGIAEALEAADERVLGRAITDTLEFRVERDGRTHDLLSYKTSFVNSRGEVEGILGSYFDITERKRVDAALAENEARLRELTSTVGEGIIMVDAERRITFANPAAEEMLGWSGQELASKALGDITERAGEEDGIERGDLAEEARRELCTVRSDDEYFLRKGEMSFPVSLIVSPIIRDGRYAGSVVAFHDITERKFTQELLNNALQELRTVLDNAQIGVAYLRNGKFSWINRHMERLFGYAIDELRQWSTGILFSSENVSGAVEDEAIAALVSGNDFEGERRMRRSSGEHFWCHLRGVAIDPSVSGGDSIWIVLDIDERKKAEDRLKALNESLAQRVETETKRSLEKERLLIQQGRSAAMGEMIGNIAHQWRQPLSTLGLVVQNIHGDYLDGELDQEALDKYVDTAKRAINRMSSTIDDFRDFFRPNRNSECFFIRQSIQETLQLLDAMLKNNGIEIELNGDETLSAFGHANEFSQVVLNLLVNAKDALVERKVGGGRIEILLECHEGNSVTIVRDNAGGIDDGMTERIFDPYFTTKATGTGIGLYMCKIIVEHHMGGSISFRNLRDGDRRVGAEFSVVIPFLNGRAGREEKT